MQITTVANLCKVLKTLALCITLLSISVTVSEYYKREQYNALLLRFMLGGLPAVEARCILETTRPEDVAPCVKASTPVKGREL